MTTVYLVRHGWCPPIGKWLAGRSAGVHLDERGCAEAEATAERLARHSVDAIYASPLERTQETAAAIARATRAPVTTLDTLIEIGYGDWTGRSIESLGPDPVWQQYVRVRSSVAPPAGEHAIDAQRRALDAVAEIVSKHPNQSVAVVTHGDVIRLVLCALLDKPADALHDYTIDPCSVTTVQYEDGKVAVVAIGDTAHLGKIRGLED